MKAVIKEVESHLSCSIAMIQFRCHVREKYKSMWWSKENEYDDDIKLSDIVDIRPGKKQTIVEIVACPPVVSCVGFLFLDFLGFNV